MPERCGAFGWRTGCAAGRGSSSHPASCCGAACAVAPSLLWEGGVVGAAGAAGAAAGRDWKLPGLPKGPAGLPWDGAAGVPDGGRDGCAKEGRAAGVGAEGSPPAALGGCVVAALDEGRAGGSPAAGRATGAAAARAPPVAGLGPNGVALPDRPGNEPGRAWPKGCLGAEGMIDRGGAEAAGGTLAVGMPGSST